MKTFRSILGLLIILFSFTSKLAYAEELVISGNGAESTSTIQATTTSESTVSQNNNAEINNTITTTADTGNNSAENNTGGESTITTGDISVATTVSNEANTSTVQSDCCATQGENKITISGNGAHSSNTAEVSNTNTTQAAVTNTAFIANNLSGSAITGNNSTSGNVGNASIKTGSITVRETIKNLPINISTVLLATSRSGIYAISVSENGTNSVNAVSLVFDDILLIDVLNVADIQNNSEWEAETGSNTADDNVGKVKVETGDIAINTEIKNGPINVSTVVVECCKENPEEPEKPEKPDTAPPPANPGSSSGGSNPPSSGSSGGSVLGASVGNILPATGNYWFFLLLMGNAFLLAFGMYLRLRSGNSPSVAYSL